MMTEGRNSWGSIFIHNHETEWDMGKGMCLLKPQSPLQVAHFLNNSTPPNRSQTVPPSGGQVFKYMSQWGRVNLIESTILSDGGKGLHTSPCWPKVEINQFLFFWKTWYIYKDNTFIVHCPFVFLNLKLCLFHLCVMAGDCFSPS